MRITKRIDAGIGDVFGEKGCTLDIIDEVPIIRYMYTLHMLSCLGEVECLIMWRYQECIIDIVEVEWL